MKIETFGIETCSMLVEFSAGIWTARKLDRSTTDEVVTSKNAQAKDAARVNKHLLAGRNELDFISKHVTAVRNYVYSNTLPWSDTGIRLLPTAKFLEFDARMQREVEKFWVLVDEFVTLYPTLITAQALQLGDMFRRDDYPSPSEIRSKFNIGVSYLPVPTVGDWRIDVGVEARAELEAKLAKLADERVEQAKKHVRDLMHEHLQRMSERLGYEQKEGVTKPRKFRDSLLDTALELVDMVRALNITNDQEIEALRQMLEQAVAGVTVEELREKPEIRDDVKARVDEILGKFTW